MAAAGVKKLSELAPSSAKLDQVSPAKVVASIPASASPTVAASGPAIAAAAATTTTATTTAASAAVAASVPAAAVPVMPTAGLEEGLVVEPANSSLWVDVDLWPDGPPMLKCVPLNPRAVQPGVAPAPDATFESLNVPMSVVLQMCVNKGLIKEENRREYGPMFEDYGVDTAQDFLDLGEEEAKALKGLKGFHRSKILKLIADEYGSVVRVPSFMDLTVYMGNLLGTGVSCMVCEGKNIRGRVAVKVLSDRRYMEQELSVLTRLMEKPHPNIISFYGMHQHSSQSGAGSYFLVLNRCVMSLRDIVEKKAFTTEQRQLYEKVRGNEIFVLKQIW